jgi:hypothetical protein
MRSRIYFVLRVGRWAGACQTFLGFSVGRHVGLCMTEIRAEMQADVYVNCQLCVSYHLTSRYFLEEFPSIKC